MTSLRTYILDFLEALEIQIPPAPKCHHVIFRSKYGSEETGWEEKFTVQLNDNGVFTQFFLDEADLNHSSPYELAHIIYLEHRKPIQNVQYGVATGQCVENN